MRKKSSPVLVVVGLIVLVVAAGVGATILKKYMPSKQVMDSSEYFQLTQEDEVAIIVNNEVLENKGKVIEGTVYLDDETVSTYINQRFYWDSNEKRMIYTLPEEMIEFELDSREYTTSEGTVEKDYEMVKSVGDSLYLPLDFIREYTDMQCVFYENPGRLVIATEAGSRQAVTVTAESPIRLKGGIKSDILITAEPEDQLYLLEEMESWSKVVSKDGYIGYIEKKNISEPVPEEWQAASETIEYSSIQKDYKINLAWHQVTSQEANTELETAIAAAAGLNTISPTWFSIVDEEGTISSLASKEYVDQAHAAGLEVWGLIDNFNKDVKTAEVLSWTSRRAKIIKQLIKIAKEVGLDGINVDFESITEEAAPHYIEFIRELSIKCRNEGLVLSVDNPVPQPYNMHYNRKEQGIVADYVIVMGYDEHYSGDTEAGSVASLGFVKAGIEQTLEEVPKDKVINGIPFYTRVWIEAYGSSNVTSEVLGMNGADNYVEEHQMETYWDSNAGQNVAVLDGSDALYQIWLEDEASIEEKMKLIRDYELAGAAAWKLGFERDSIWAVIGQYLE